MYRTGPAGRYGSDKGSRKRRHTERYRMLCSPYRGRRIRFPEMALQIGGPDHGNPAGRAATDVASIRIWLEYIPRAGLVRLDISDFAAFQQPRFRFVHCDTDNPAALFGGGAGGRPQRHRPGRHFARLAPPADRVPDALSGAEPRRVLRDRGSALATRSL